MLEHAGIDVYKRQVGTAVVNLICIAVGIVLALLLDRFNSRVEVK